MSYFFNRKGWKYVNETLTVGYSLRVTVLSVIASEAWQSQLFSMDGKFIQTNDRRVSRIEALPK